MLFIVVVVNVGFFITNRVITFQTAEQCSINVQYYAHCLYKIMLLDYLNNFLRNLPTTYLTLL